MFYQKKYSFAYNPVLSWLYYKLEQVKEMCKHVHTISTGDNALNYFDPLISECSVNINYSLILR